VTNWSAVTRKDSGVVNVMISTSRNYRFCLFILVCLLPAQLLVWKQSLAQKDPSPKHDRNNGAASSELCRVRFSYFLHVQPRMASNQLALWIENMQGDYIATVFATDYTARGGYQQRPLSLPQWRRASNWDQVGPDYVDAVTMATPISGEHTTFWDCRDENGLLVAPGRYLYKMEGIIFWENRVVWTGEIGIFVPPDQSQAKPEYIPERAFRKGILLENVRAQFIPGRP